MLEVVFSDSTKGSMKVAKNYDEKGMLGGAIGYRCRKDTGVGDVAKIQVQLMQPIYFLLQPS